MVCFYHPDRPAVGVCKHCGRALCAEDVVAIGDILACKGRHEEQVEAAGEMFRRNLLQSKRVGSNYIRNTIFYGLVAVLFAGFGLMQYRFLGLQAIFFMLIGVFLLYAAVANFLESRKYK